MNVLAAPGTPVAHPATGLDRYTTPQILKGGIGAVWVLCLLMVLLALGAAEERRKAAVDMGSSTEPSVIAAQDMRFRLADMDAEAANELLVKPGESAVAHAAYELARTKVATSLVSAAKNVTFGEDEERPIRTIAIGLGTYESTIQQARDYQLSGNRAIMLAKYREATKLIDDTLLPAAKDLETVNHKAFDAAYANQDTNEWATFGLLVFECLFLIATLLAIQQFISVRMRRTLNPLLLLGAAVTFLLLGLAVQDFVNHGNDLRVANKDAFQSEDHLWTARTVAHEANAAESRYLLDRDNAAQYEASFMMNANQIARVPGNSSYSEILARIKDRSSKDLGFTGRLADELNNITFEGEGAAASEALSKFGKYMEIDQQIRSLEHAGRHDAAIALCTGDSNTVFDQFDKALDQTLEINHRQFEAHIESAKADVWNLPIAAPVAAILVALLTLFGVLPRIREYQI